MSLSKELLELLTVILPLLISLAPFFAPPQRVAAWVIAIIATATTSLLSTGLLMLRARATTSCFVVQPSCDSASVVVTVNLGLFDRYNDCSLCIPARDINLAFSLAQAINERILELAIGSWAVCSFISVLMIGRFIQWSKRQRNSASQQ